MSKILLDPSRGVEPLYSEYKSDASPQMLRRNKNNKRKLGKFNCVEKYWTRTSHLKCLKLLLYQVS